ncbi:hypothetical protein [Trichothermofontia sp.]
MVQADRTPLTVEREEFSDYVAHLQLHMALQARNLVPSLRDAQDSRATLLQQTQADFEKWVSRQTHT